MRKIIYLFLIALSFSSCTSLTKFNHFVNEKYSNSSLTSYDYKTDFVNVNTNGIIKQDSLCRTERIKGTFIPAIFYWYWNNTVKCIVDPKYYADKMAYYLKTGAEASDMKEKLKGGAVNISIKSLPHSFMYENKGHLLFAVFAYAMIYKEGIRPVPENLILEYEVIKNDSVIQKGTVEISDNNQYVKKTLSSRKKLTWQFIDTYESNLKAQSKEAIMKILNEI
jgi:hypothetical protein